MEPICKPKFDETPQVIAVSTTASGATAVLPPKCSTFVEGLYKFRADHDCYVKLGDSSVDDPDIDGTSGDGRCWRLFAGQEELIHLDAAQSYVNVICDSDIGSTFLRIGFELAA
jgi:hypothetical protein